MKKHFITGLLVLLPLAITTWVVASIVNMLTHPFIDFVKPFLTHMHLEREIFFFTGQQILHYMSQIVILLGIILFTILLGILTQTFLMHQLLRIGNYVLHHIPLVNKIYKLSQDVVKPFFQSQTQSFQKVVMVPFPSKEMYCIGFLTEDSPSCCSSLIREELMSVFIPTSPNPISGYMAMFKKKDILHVDMKVEDAVKFIISCGVIYPKEYQLSGQEADQK